MPRFCFISVRRAAVLALALLFLPTIELSAQATASSQPVTREVVDEVGRTVRVPLSPSRVVSLAPSLTETLYALGLEDRLVGDTDYCDYPPDAQSKPKVGGAINPNLEQIAALHPDLVLVTKALNRLDTVRALEALGISSYATDPRSVEGIISSTERLADVLGASEAGKTLGEKLENRLATIQTRLNGVAASRVLFIVWTEPLISVGKDTFIADALRKAGALSIVDSTQDWPQMSLEEVVRLQPDYLVFASSHSEAAARDFEALAARPGWRILDAVHSNHFAVISDAVNRPAPRIVSAIEELARQLHPAAFQDSPGYQRETPPATPTQPTSPPQRALSFLSPNAPDRCPEFSCAR
jgi:iron complex transport system substrate-binding protein